MSKSIIAGPWLNSKPTVRVLTILPEAQSPCRNPLRLQRAPGGHCGPTGAAKCSIAPLPLKNPPTRAPQRPFRGLPRVHSAKVLSKAVSRNPLGPKKPGHGLVSRFSRASVPAPYAAFVHRWPFCAACRSGQMTVDGDVRRSFRMTGPKKQGENNRPYYPPTHPRDVWVGCLPFQDLLVEAHFRLRMYAMSFIRFRLGNAQDHMNIAHSPIAGLMN